MNRFLLFTIACFLGFESQAVVVDKFRCTLKIEDLKGKVTHSTTSNFSVDRVLTGQRETNGVRTEMTTGQSRNYFSFQTKFGLIKGSWLMYYLHSTKLYPKVEPQASQHSCMAMGIRLCKTVSAASCPQSEASCFFDGEPPSRPIPLVDGIPVFDEQGIGFPSAEIQDDRQKPIGRAQLSCHFLGTRW